MPGSRMMDGARTEPLRRTRMKRACGFVLGCLFVAGCVLLVRLSGQQSIQSMPNQPTAPNQSNKSTHVPFEGMPDVDPGMASRQMRALNVMRQKSMVSDTDKLLKLAQELNQEIETGNSTALTPVQLRKIGDIEKLARNVKQKMSISYSGGPSFDEPISR
jgi:PBP1b-binding outer membrane lipoprotein LpoB